MCRRPSSCARSSSAPGGTSPTSACTVHRPLHLEKLWIKDVTITTGLVDTYSTPRLLSLVAEHQLDPAALMTQTFPLDRMMAAYDAFSHAAETGAIKVVCKR